MGGGSGIFNLAAGQVNKLGFDTTVGAHNTGFFLFDQTTNPALNTPNALSGNAFDKVIGNPPLGPGLLPQGLVFRADETVAAATPINTGPISGGKGTAAFDALNAIAFSLGGFPELTLGMHDAFATNFGGRGNTAGPTENYNPSSSASGSPNTSDIVTNLGFVGSSFATVPEPASVTLVLCAGFSFGGYVGLRRWRRKQA
jgi:hypothetical protein